MYKNIHCYDYSSTLFASISPVFLFAFIEYLIVMFRRSKNKLLYDPTKIILRIPINFVNLGI